MRSLRDCLAQRDIKLVFVQNASKVGLYPQYLPFPLPAEPPRLARRLAEVLQQEPGLVFIDGEKILSEHKDEILFYKTDLHMEQKGGWYVYGQMLPLLANLTGKPEPKLVTLTWTAEKWNYGVEERFLAKFLPMKDSNFSTQIQSHAEESDEFGTYEFKVGKSELPDHPDLPIFNWIFTNKRASSALLPPTMFFGTSFAASFFGLRFNELFEKVYYTHAIDIERIEPTMRHLPSDVKIFLLEHPEPFLMNLAAVLRPPVVGIRYPHGAAAVQLIYFPLF